MPPFTVRANASPHLTDPLGPVRGSRWPRSSLGCRGSVIIRGQRSPVRSVQGRWDGQQRRQRRRQQQPQHGRAAADGSPPPLLGSWDGQVDDDWNVEPPESEEDELDLFPEPSMDPEYLLQNALALTLITLLLLSTGNVLIKLVFVGYTLVAAAFRYVAVGVLLLVLLVVFS